MMSSRASKQNIDELEPLDKKVPRNPKYENVEPTVDTGASMTRYMKKLEDIKKNYRFRKDELFKRMKVTTFVQLLVQVHRSNRLASYQRAQMDNNGDSHYRYPDDYEEETARSGRADTEIADEEIEKIGGRGLRSAASLTLTEGDYGAPSVASSRSTLQSVIRGVGEFDIANPTVEPMEPMINENIPYLILDVRDSDDFEQFHIISALNYPPAMLSRSFNSETKEMRNFRNVPGRIIVIYDEDERLAPNAASILVQRGYDNLFMLSGGLKVALKVFPEGLITGTIPKKLLADIYPQTGKTSRTTARSSLPPASVAGDETDRRLANQCDLTDDDIDKLETQLDFSLSDKASVSSRTTSRSSRISKASSGLSEKRPFR